MIAKPPLGLAGLRRHPVLLCGLLDAHARARADRFFEVETLDVTATPTRLRERLTDKAALLIGHPVLIDEDFLRSLHWLHAICRLSPGSAGIDLDACTRRGIFVTDVPAVPDRPGAPDRCGDGSAQAARANADAIAVENLIAAFGFGRLGGRPPNLINIDLRCLLGCCA